MESNTESMVVNRNLKSPAEAEHIETKVKIENYSDDKGNVKAVEQLSPNAKTIETPDEKIINPGEKTGIEVVVEAVEVMSNDEEVDSDSNVGDALKIENQPKMAIEEDNDKSDKSVEITVKTSPPTLTTANVTINAQMVGEPQPEKFESIENVKEQESVQTEIEKKEEEASVKVDDKTNITVAVSSKETEEKVNEHTIPVVGSSALQLQNSHDQVDTEQLKQQEERQAQTESTDAKKIVDLQKIFTPATDAEQIPRNRKLYASSAFYSPTLHPTVEDQVELARRISHSLSDISNHKSKGQTMFVNRKKRSVKWVHEGAGQDSSVDEEFKENTIALSSNHNSPYNKLSLRLLMNPRGKLHDITSVSDPFNAETGLLSPDKCAELVMALQTQKGKGAELFAKRRRKSDKWVVDKTNTGTQSPPGLLDYHQQLQQQVRSPTSPSILTAYSYAGKHRVQLNLQQEQLLEKYAKPGLKVVKTPWEAALETGFASTAFVEDAKQKSKRAPTPSITPVPLAKYQHSSSTVPKPVPRHDGYDADYNKTPSHKLSPAPFLTYMPRFSNNPQRDLAYKPSLPQGWKAPGVTLPQELYLPKNMSLDCYTPSAAENVKEENFKPSWKPSMSASSTIVGSFPLGNPNNLDFLDTTPPLTQQTSKNLAQINYTPSALPYEKIAKFENAAEQQAHNSIHNSQRPRLAVQMGIARNVTPTPFCEMLRHDEPLFDSSHQSIFLKPNEATYSSTLTPSTKYFSPNELLHGQNYNNIARGWTSSGCGDVSISTNDYSQWQDAYKTLDVGGYNAYKPKVLMAVSTLPYTDF